MLNDFDLVIKLFHFRFRLRGLLLQLRTGEVSADVLQKNLRYAADVLEAVYIDETKYVFGYNKFAHKLKNRGASNRCEYLLLTFNKPLLTNILFNTSVFY